MRGAMPVLFIAHLISITVNRQVSALNPALRIPVNVSGNHKEPCDEEIDDYNIE